MDAQSFPRLSWGVCPFSSSLAGGIRTQLLGFRLTDGDTFTLVTGVVEGAQVIAVGKFPAGTLPFYYAHTINVPATATTLRITVAGIATGCWPWQWKLPRSKT